jgi:hypothetical protein
MGTLHGDVFTFKTISRWILLGMRNVLGENRRENENTDIMFDTFLSKIVPFAGKSRKLWWYQRGHKWHSKVHERCKLSKQGYKRGRICTFPRIWKPPHTYVRARARTHTHTHTHTHTQTNMLFHWNNGFANAPRCYVIRTLAVLFKSTHCFCLVLT